MFLDNKYSRIYFSIVKVAKNRIFPDGEYFEKHHIIPKSLGGLNNSSNIVKLTAREHFVCHLLLTKMLSGQSKQKMISAAWYLANTRCGKSGKINSRTYEILRKLHSENVRLQFKGRPKSEEHKQKIGQAHKGRAWSETHRENVKRRMKANHPFKGKKLSESHKSALVTAAALACRGKKYSTERRNKHKELFSGAKNPRSKTWVLENEKLERITVECCTVWCREREMTLTQLRNSSKAGKFRNGWRIVFN